MQKLNIENILGYPVISNNFEECLTVIDGWLDHSPNEKTFVCANPHSLYEASKDDLFKKSLLDADLITPDGAGILLASKFLGGDIRQRITGSDVFFGLSEYLNKKKKGKYFFLGSTEDTLAQIRDKMAADYPGIQLAGTYSPPFKPVFDEADNDSMIEAINAVNPDVLWVGMTAPKQEKWIFENRGRLNVKFIGAIGAVFDFYVGNVKRSHPVFQKMGLEWLPRLIQEPKRLWRRNFVSSPMFLLKVFKQKFS